MSANDKRIKSLIKKVEDQKVAMSPKPKLAWDTNALFKYPNGSTLNLNTISDIQKPIHALSALLSQCETQQKACKLLGVDFDFEWNGYSLKEWTDDFKLCVDKVKYSEEDKKLKELTKKLNSLVSKETRTEMELDDIEGLLK